MSKDPVTKADLVAFADVVLEQLADLRKEITDFKAEVDRQFHFVAEELSKLLTKCDEIDQPVASCDHQETVADHERRIRRLEGRQTSVA